MTAREALLRRVERLESALVWTPDPEWVNGLDEDELVDYVCTLARAEGWQNADEARVSP